MNNNPAQQVEKKDKWFFIFSFVPFLQWIPCFMMNARVPSKKYIIMGFVCVFIVMQLFISPFFFLYVVGITFASWAISLIFYFIFMIVLFFIERPKYYRALLTINNRSRVKNTVSRLSSPSDSKNLKKSKNDEDNLKENITYDVEDKISVNDASEQELIDGLGLSVMDAKKVIAYREKNGKFTNTDEFYKSFNAKPHIIVRTENMITLNNIKTSDKEQNVNTINRASTDKKSDRIDI